LSGDTFTSSERYVLEGDSYYDPLISASIGGSDRFYVYDGLGSTRHLLDSDQAVTDTYTYEAFGNLMGSSGSTPNLAKRRLHRGRRRRHGGAAWPHLATYRYVGSLGYYQTGSSLQHLGARYYMPEIGRFPSKDPVGFPSQYTYAENAPTVGVDPTGDKVILDKATCNLAPRCNPARDRQAIEDRIRFVNGVVTKGLQFLQQEGGLTLAATSCECRQGVNTGIVRCGAAYWHETGCVQKCINEHEWTHGCQCQHLGPAKYGDPANSWPLEKEAYSQELACLRSLLRGGGGGRGGGGAD
jgi:RHS repeat-associated protein